MYFHYKSMADNNMPGAWPVWTPGVLLTGFIKRSTIHCSTQNMKALGQVVLEKIFLSFSNNIIVSDPRGGAIFDPRGTIRSIYVMLQITMLYTKYRNFSFCSFREEDFYMYFPL